MTWTDERVSELARLWDLGLSASDIGKALGVSKNAVVGKAHRMNLPARPSPIKRGASRSKTTPPAKQRQPRLMERLQCRPLPQRREGARQTPAEAKPVAPAIRRETGSSSCLWPIGDPTEADFHFCGAPAVEGKPYCEEHCTRAYITRSKADSKAA